MMWLGIVGVALGGITLALLLSGGDGRAEISAELSEYIPEIAGFFEVSTMADLREFNEPRADLRARFTSSGEVYRVIDSSGLLAARTWTQIITRCILISR